MVSCNYIRIPDKMEIRKTDEETVLFYDNSGDCAVMRNDGPSEIYASGSQRWSFSKSHLRLYYDGTVYFVGEGGAKYYRRSW